MKKLKYLAILIIPIATYISFNSKGLLTYLPVIIAFGFVPLLELVFKPDHTNMDEVEAELANKNPYYNFMLYIMVPIQIGALLLFFNTIQEELSTVDYIGRILSMGVMCGVFGINVGHELGHRTENRFEQLLGEILLMTSLETHFLPYHNSGHHFNVATPEDPATARKNEWLFTFWFRSQIGSYIQAWQLEKKKLKIQKKTVFSINNRMLVYTILQIILLTTIYFYYGFQILILFLTVSLIGILLLETVNYIEHYGLLRKKKKSGRYEVVTPKHSWNSDHIVGRILLFELSRHSDHHHRANKHYQILDSHKGSPQMYTGYPGMMLLALIPPLWFKIMNKQLNKYQTEH
ncbi:alkane 1-monooxygenase [Urechidicola croceus]|uniref:Alkane 1-monooxygenase n=1 Tax=Urechidicola croceus TaxID=1850246 RepID=A0A1D8PAU8_9FLAO|nr:alkane 1-monooxygenase [Urechidicola croceus]AOW21700.1 alkane 1-monooxygenase [Urechidicola croceus]